MSQNVSGCIIETCWKLHDKTGKKNANKRPFLFGTSGHWPLVQQCEGALGLSVLNAERDETISKDSFMRRHCCDTILLAVVHMASNFIG